MVRAMTLGWARSAISGLAEIVRDLGPDPMSAADRSALLETAAAVEKTLRADVPKQDGLAVMLMSNQGLKVTKATGADWAQQGEILAKAMRGQMVPPDVFDLAMKERDAFRQHKTAAALK